MDVTYQQQCTFFCRGGWIIRRLCADLPEAVALVTTPKVPALFHAAQFMASLLQSQGFGHLSSLYVQK